ncbi:MAG: DUF983 domain-containing protein [bacterium]|nr:DUF983 domain-containing protein [Candidatus Kapabacteria bacterium]
MNNQCPVCGMKFEREPGYFVGAMYISYIFAACFIGTVSFIISIAFPRLDFIWSVCVAGAFMLPFVPLMVRYSKVIWLAIDRSIDP